MHRIRKTPPENKTGKGRYWLRARVGDGNAARIIEPKGREAWTLWRLAQAGPRGVSSIENIGPRLSSYVHDLRHVFGLDIETQHESHGGAFPGTHGRYFLRSPVEVMETSGGPVQPENPFGFSGAS